MKRADSEVNGLNLGSENRLARALREIALQGVGGTQVLKLFYDFVQLASLVEALPAWQPSEYELYKSAKDRRRHLLTQLTDLEGKYKFKVDVSHYSPERLAPIEKEL